MDGGSITPDCVRVDFACNDGRTGAASGYVHGMTIGRSEPLEFEAVGTVPFVIGVRAIWIVESRFATLGQAHWVGSMAWDGFWMTVSEAERLLVLAHRHKWFTLSSGEAILFQQWRQHCFGGLHLRHQLTMAGLDQMGRS